MITKDCAVFFVHFLADLKIVIKILKKDTEARFISLYY